MEVMPISAQSIIQRDRVMEMTDSYKFAGPYPALYRNLEDDYTAIYNECVRLHYYCYTFRGLVCQIEPGAYIAGAQRFFISFIMLNDGRQKLYEASSTNTVWNATQNDNALKDFLEAMEDNVKNRVRVIL